MATLPLAHVFDRTRWQRIADAFVVAIAVSLPWSTSATGILVGIWLVVLIPALDWPELRRIVARPAGGLSVLLVFLGAVGMLWADVSWVERWHGVTSFLKLLTIPLLFLQFMRSERGRHVFAGYLIACLLLLLASYVLAVWPRLPRLSPDFGVLVKNAPSQSGEFAICIAGLVYLAQDAVRRRAFLAAAAGILVILAMLADIAFIATGRTALVILLVLAVIYAVTQPRGVGVLMSVIVIVVLTSAAWFASPYLRHRVEQIWTEAQVYEQTDARTSSGERIEFAKKSLAFMREAPFIGHGTGSIHAQFEKAAAGHTGTQGVASTNPHNQTFAVGIQLGLVGIAVLWAMWVAHLLLFRAAGFVSWIGLLIVTQNIVGSIFNSHLFDFLQGWTYVVGVGVAGGMLLRAQRQERMTPLSLPPRPRILVVALRRLGDVLLTTPLIRSLRRAYPEARIEALVFADTAGILQGNRDIDRTIAMPPRPSALQTIACAARLVGRYDLAVSVQSGDRPAGFAILAGRQRVAPVEERFSGRIKRALLQRAVPYDPRAHRVEANLHLADALGIARVPEVVPPGALEVAGLPPGEIAVVHAAPMFHYKRWTMAGWRALAAVLAQRGLQVVATGGPGADERAYLDAVWESTSVTRVDGRLSWGELTGLLARARIFIGPDTSVTHLAAATGCPTVALYGPTDPRLWGPWPFGGLSEPWTATGAVQRRGNVWLVQHAFACTPCQLEGCERRLESYSACLDALSLEQAMMAIEEALSVHATARLI